LISREGHELRVKVHARHPRHHEIAEYDVEAFSTSDEIPRLLCARERDHVVVGRQDSPYAVANCRLVVDDEEKPFDSTQLRAIVQGLVQ